MLELYEKLNEEDQNWLETKLPKAQVGLPDELIRRNPDWGGIRAVLESYGNSFTVWRYSYESSGAFFSDARLFEVQEALAELFEIRWRDLPAVRA